MEFETTLHGENYRFSLLYKTKTWRCADDLPMKTVEKLGVAIEEHLHVLHA